MSDLPLLRQFLNERLIAAAEEVFGAVEKIVVDLQREVSRTKEDSERQRRLLDAVIKPDLILHKIDHPPDIPPAPVEVHPQREQWFGLIQEDPATPPRVKVEPHLWSGQTGGEPFHGLDTGDPTSPPPPCVESDSDIVRVEVGPGLENRLHTNNGDSDGEHAGLEASNDFEHLSALVPDGSSEEYQYQCNVCGKCFKYKASFKSHKLIHSSEKPYRCKECGSSFRYRGHLNRHKQKHEDQRLLKSECRAVGFAKEENATFHQARCEERTTYRRAESGDGFESNDMCLKDESRTRSLEEPCRSEEVPSERKPSEQGFYDLLVPENPGELPQIKQEENPWTGQIGELDTDPTAAPLPCVERDPDVVRVEVGPYLSPEVENILLTNTYGDIDRGHAGLESGQYLSVAVPVGLTGDCQYQCKVCGKCFKYKGNLKCHKLIHTGEKPYKCKECNLSFRYKGHLNRHRRVHTGEKPYTCQICGKGFTRNESLTFHCENQHLKPRFLVQREEPPPLQGRSQENVWARVEMGRGPEEVSFTGSVLPPPWAASDGVLDVPPPSRRFLDVPPPSRRFHSVAVETGLWPDTDRDVLGGGRGEVDPQLLSAPVPTFPAEEKPYRCEFCGKCFKYKSNFNGHKLIHTGEKPHKCKECSLSFRYRGHLNRHKWVHTGEKPYKCKTCGKRFTRKESLTCHKLSHGGGV